MSSRPERQRILDGIAHRLGIRPEKIVYTLAKHGNTSAASIPLALNQAVEDRRSTEGRLVLMESQLQPGGPIYTVLDSFPLGGPLRSE